MVVDLKLKNFLSGSGLWSQTVPKTREMSVVLLSIVFCSELKMNAGSHSICAFYRSAGHEIS